MNCVFNMARMAYQGQILTAKEIATLLSEMPYSTHGLFVTTLVKHNAIKRIGKGQYMFTNNPIHYSILEKVIAELRTYTKKYNDKKHISKAENKSDIQKAIDLLLSTGEYEIFRIEKIITVKKTQL